MKTQRRIFLDLLMVLWGWGTWLGVNSVFVQLPLLIERLPEGFTLPSFMTIAVQLGNTGAILYAVLRMLFPRAPDAPYIHVLLVILTGALYMCSFLYTETTVIAGSERSLTFLIFTFCVALVGCTSSVVFYPYLRHFREIYLGTYLVGEGLSGFLPSILALIQGVGGQPECIYSSDNQTVEVVIPPPRFESTIFFIIVGSLGLISLISFAMLDNFPSFSSERISSDSESKEEMTLSKPIVVWETNFIGALVLIACLNAIMNGMLPSIQSYSCMPYGRNIYHLSVVLGTMANPVACMAGVWLKPVGPRVLAAILLVILVPFSYIFVTAALSPAPPLYTNIGGKILVVMSWVAVLGVISYSRMWIYNYARRRGNVGMKACGYVGQVGSMLGSITMFMIINVAKAFTAMQNCPLPPINLNS